MSLTAPTPGPFLVEELHFSDLKNMAKSPAHLRYGVEAGWKPNRAMNVGTIAHALLLGGDFVVYEGRRHGKKWEEFEAEHEGRMIVTRKERDEAAAMASSVDRHPIASRLLVGDHERPWTATMYGRKCAGRIDVAGPDTVELKTTNDAEPNRFQRQCLRMAYHAQLAWYQDARRALGEGPGEAYIVGVESKAPYPVTVFHLTERALLEGRKLTRLWIERLAACEAADEWPGYVQSVVELDIVEDAGLVIDGEEVEAA